jgi:glutamate synthase (NADPH/NADH) small chain
MVKSLGVEFRQRVEIGQDVSFQQLEKDFDAIFIGVGLGETWAMNIPGEDLHGVCGALEFIEPTKSQPFAQVAIGRRVACIGAGNTAIDVVTAARRLGAETVYIVYRRSEQEMSAFHYEFDLAKRDGVNFLWQTQPVRILGSDGVVTGVECVRTRLGEPDARGKRAPETIPNSAFTIDVDMVVRAVGQQQATDFLRAVQGIEVRKSGTIVIDAQHRTGNPKYFAGGDCVNGGREVVDAVAEGMAAGRGIDQWLDASSDASRRGN